MSDRTETVHRILTADPVLIARRQTVEAYMRQMATLLWRCPEDMLYTTSTTVDRRDATGFNRLELVGGRLYRGMPYTHASGTLAGFLELAGTEMTQGVLVAGSLPWQPFCGTGSTTARISNDCSSSVCQSWARIDASVDMVSTKFMVPDRGFLRVGDYDSNPADNTDSDKTVAENGRARMYAAYAQLQTGDAVVCRSASSGHVMMAVETRVVRTADGAIDGAASTLTVLEQSREFFKKGEFYFDETLGENVYAWYGLDKVYTFDQLFEIAYLPVTCRELVDPAEPEATWVRDSETVFGREALCRGVISSNRFLDSAMMTVTDPAGKAVQLGTLVAQRSAIRQIDLRRFVTEDPALLQSSIDPDALAPGHYICTLTVRLSKGTAMEVRKFDFEVN